MASTTEKFRFPWDSYKDNQCNAKRGEDHAQKYFHKHFRSHGHNGLINDVKIIFIDKIDPSDPTRREEFWRSLATKNTSIEWPEHRGMSLLVTLH